MKKYIALVMILLFTMVSAGFAAETMKTDTKTKTMKTTQKKTMTTKKTMTKAEKEKMMKKAKETPKGVQKAAEKGKGEKKGFWSKWFGGTKSSTAEAGKTMKKEMPKTKTIKK